MDRLVTIISQIEVDVTSIPRQTPPDSGSITTLIQIMFGIMGAIAVLIITISSLLFALSRGDPGKSARARNAIIYSAIGLAVAILGASIIEFVIGKV